MSLELASSPITLSDSSIISAFSEETDSKSLLPTFEIPMSSLIETSLISEASIAFSAETPLMTSITKVIRVISKIICFLIF